MILATAKIAKAKSSSLPFLTGGCASTLGQNVPILNEPLHAVKRDKSKTALSRHKKWLHELQEERARLEEMLRGEENRKAEQRRRFQAREAKMRALVRRQGNNHPESEEQEEAQRPMWARTKDSAEKELERREEEDTDALLDFAANLDIDEFMDRVENKALLEKVTEQMSELEKEVAQEEAEERKLELAELRAAEPKLGALNAENLASLQEKDTRENDEDDLVSVASTALSECKSIRSVHSSRSLSVLTKRAKAKIENLGPIPEDDYEGPKIITHDIEAGTRISKKNDPSNLPYMHRNPSI